MHRLVRCCQLTLSSVHETPVLRDLSTLPTVSTGLAPRRRSRRGCLNILLSENTHPDLSLSGVKTTASVLLLSGAGVRAGARGDGHLALRPSFYALAA